MRSVTAIIVFVQESGFIRPGVACPIPSFQTHLVGKHDDVVLHAQSSYCKQLGAGKNLPNGVMSANNRRSVGSRYFVDGSRVFYDEAHE